MMYKCIYKVGEFIRNNKISKHYKRLKLEQYYSDDELKKVQTERLRKLIRHAKETTAYYQVAFKNINVDTFEVEDLYQIPILTKKKFRENSSDFFSNKFKKKDCFYSETSGSSGEPLVFYRDRDWDAAHRAAILRGYSWHDVKPWNRSIYFWGFMFSPLSKLKVRILDLLQNRYRVFTYTDESFGKIVEKVESSEYIEGYSSSINKLATTVIDKNISVDSKKLKLIKCTSEKIYDSYKHNVKVAFGKDIVSEYGAAETGIIAFSCEKGEMHITEENVILEIVDGRAVVTNLFSFSMPLIRYDLGDYVSISSERCQCGRKHRLVKDVLGRVGKDILGEKEIYPSLVLYYIFKKLAINYNIALSYQGVQYKSGHLTIYLYPDGELSSLISSKILEVCSEFFKDDIIVSIETKNPVDRNEKMKDFVSYL
ncbi:phenylacetate--CoA ligase family protein [Vibrio parahaemolyticus]|nr:phenylacetate--CoA ligase family protein [Vibrio parahaemolyticus]HCH2722804.1 phenylacetate--CoA ligase family protein [Vibrio parahaemolyticus]HCM0801507.1 phenylacetate--CoA ligase family protein [Vibrio parahaemolyticus]